MTAPDKATCSTKNMNAEVIERWLDEDRVDVGRHSLLLMSEKDGARVEVWESLHEIVANHYVDPKITAQRIADLGSPKSANALLIEDMPSCPKARSGSLGEILATEVAESKLGYKVPIRRLRWQEGRNMAMRGDDVIGILITDGKLALLKGEAKSRKKLSTSALSDATNALEKHQGLPARNSILFIAKRLREQTNGTLATKLEEALLNSFAGTPIEHMLFVLCGTYPKKLLEKHLLNDPQKPTKCHAVAIHIADHGDFICNLYESFRWSKLLKSYRSV